MANLNDLLVSRVQNSWAETATAVNAAAVATHAAVAGKNAVVGTVSAGFSATPNVGATLIVQFGATTKFQVPMPSGVLQPVQFYFGAEGVENPTTNQAVSATLSGGGVGIVGFVNLSGFDAEPPA